MTLVNGNRTKCKTGEIYLEKNESGGISAKDMTDYPKYPCRDCGNILRFIDRHQQWWCSRCQKFVGEHFRSNLENDGLKNHKTENTLQQQSALSHQSTSHSEKVVLRPKRLSKNKIQIERNSDPFETMISSLKKISKESPPSQQQFSQEEILPSPLKSEIPSPPHFHGAQKSNSMKKDSSSLSKSPTKELFASGSPEKFESEKYVKTLVQDALNFESQGKYDNALLVIDKAVKIKLESNPLWVLKGNMLNKLNQFEEALICFERATNIDPKDAIAWNNKGNTFARLNKYFEALTSYDNSLKIAPNRIETWQNKSKILKKINRIDEALDCLEKVIKIKQGSKMHITVD